MTYGIGLTSQNRRHIALDSLEQIKKYSPNAKIVIVDDASEVPFPDADYRFDKIAGVAKAKNKCLELLEDCDYIFLFDDDCYPKELGWEQYYIKSEANQLQFIFERFKTGMRTTNRLVKHHGHLIEYSNPAGCMIFLTKKCLETIGGFDTDFDRYGYEHTEYSNRAFNAGLTVAPFLDIQDSLRLFYSYDYEQQLVSTIVNPSMRNRLFAKNKKVYLSKVNDKHFKEYK